MALLKEVLDILLLRLHKLGLNIAMENREQLFIGPMGGKGCDFINGCNFSRNLSAKSMYTTWKKKEIASARPSRYFTDSVRNFRRYFLWRREMKQRVSKEK